MFASKKAVSYQTVHLNSQCSTFKYDGKSGIHMLNRGPVLFILIPTCKLQTGFK